jgi:predicted DNA-binding ribbon-helix-helix protein
MMRPSGIEKRSVDIGGHKTSISLEDEFWQELKSLARAQHMTLGKLIGIIDIDRTNKNLSSSLRLYVLEQYQGKVTE